MKKIAFVILNLLFIVQPVRAESVRQRFLRLQVSVESLFPSPSSELENQFFATGQAKWWQTYYGRQGYESESYKGYVRNSDPYHQGLQRISFHLASDCSSFVHRLYQVFGANFPFAKTRNLLALGDFLKSKMSPREYYEMRAQKIRPLDLPYCQWQALAESFRLVEDMSEALTGDLYVYARKKGWRGSYGHVVMVAQPHPFRVIHARNPKT